MFLFFSTRNFRDPSADHRETLPRDRNLVKFYNACAKIRGGVLPPTKFGAKNMKNVGRFYTTFDFDREYLRKRLKISKIGKIIHLEQFLLHYTKKIW